MKKLLLIASAFVIGLSVSAQQNAAGQQKTDDLIKLKTEKFDFGKIKQGTPVTTYFEFTNTSDRPVVIESAVASCGCTTPEYTKEAILPNTTTKIKVGFNAGATGPFTKPVTLKLAGVSDTKVITITGEVLDAAAYDTYVKNQKTKGAAAKTTKGS
jgi:hypothetical protein